MLPRIKSARLEMQALVKKPWHRIQPALKHATFMALTAGFALSAPRGSEIPRAITGAIVIYSAWQIVSRLIKIKTTPFFNTDSLPGFAAALMGSLVAGYIANPAQLQNQNRPTIQTHDCPNCGHSWKEAR